MHASGNNGALRIGEVASRVGTTADTVRYYEKVGLLGPAGRSEGGYRLYGEAELGRLRFVRRAKQLGLSLEEIRGLLGLADEGECRPLRSQVADLLRSKIRECDAKLAELTAFKASLEERYQLALESQDLPACGCATFPASCPCLPIRIEEGVPTMVMTDTKAPRGVEELKLVEQPCACGCGCMLAKASDSSAEYQSVERSCSCGCGCDSTTR